MTAPVLLELPDLGLTVEAARSVAVVGPNADALWRRLAGAPGRPEGAVLYKGADVAAWSAARRRQSGILALFERPRATPGMTLPALLRAAGAGRALRSTLRLSAERLGVPEALLERPLDDAAWSPFGAEAEWLQACVLEPELVVSAARPVKAALELMRERGAGLVLTARRGT